MQKGVFTLKLKSRRSTAHRQSLQLNSQCLLCSQTVEEKGF